ncbi:MAG: MerR family transcriptional regulator [Dermatophilaceae bacterium]
MRISELADAGGVPVHTVKYYLREGLLMPGRATSRTRAEYGTEHLDRLRLVRSLVEHGGLGLADVRRILDALEAPPASRHDLLGVAHESLPGVRVEDPTADSDAVVLEALADAGWPVEHDGPALSSLIRAVTAARDAGVPLTRHSLARYARAMRRVARVDLDVVGDAPSAAEALRIVVVGTVMVDPVLAALRRVAQSVESADR